jgi:hypothetical protein
MKKLLLVIPYTLMFVGALLLFERPAYAYTDPGTGLLAIQAVGSALIATGWYLRQKIYSLLRWGSGKKQSAAEPSLKDEQGAPLP